MSYRNEDSLFCASVRRVMPAPHHLRRLDFRHFGRQMTTLSHGRTILRTSAYMGTVFRSFPPSFSPSCPRSIFSDTENVRESERERRRGNPFPSSLSLSLPDHLNRCLSSVELSRFTYESSLYRMWPRLLPVIAEESRRAAPSRPIIWRQIPAPPGTTVPNI